MPSNDWETLSFNQAENVNFFESGNDKTVKAGWALSFICCAQDTVGQEPPLPLQIFGYGKSLLLPINFAVFLLETLRISKVQGYKVLAEE